MSEVGVDFYIFVVLTKELLVLHNEPLLLYWGCSRQDIRSSTGFGLADKGEQYNKGILDYRQEVAKLAVLVLIVLIS